MTDSTFVPANACLALFARLPVPGSVKTRLIPALGAEGACRLHVRLMGKALQLLQNYKTCNTCLWLDKSGEHEVLNNFSGTVYVQSGENLGARMLHAACRLFDANNSVFFIGTDCPDLDAAYLDNALAAMHAGADVVIGPARDGGYVMLGINTPCEALFRGIDWGTDKVLSQTLEAAAGANLRVSILPELADIDRPEDLHLLPAH